MDTMYYLRTISDTDSIKGLWTDLELAKAAALKYSKELNDVVLVFDWNGRRVYHTDQK